MTFSVSVNNRLYKLRASARLNPARTELKVSKLDSVARGFNRNVQKFNPQSKKN